MIDLRHLTIEQMHIFIAQCDEPGEVFLIPLEYFKKCQTLVTQISTSNSPSSSTTINSNGPEPRPSAETNQSPKSFAPRLTANGARPRTPRDKLTHAVEWLLASDDPKFLSPEIIPYARSIVAIYDTYLQSVHHQQGKDSLEDPSSG